MSVPVKDKSKDPRCKATCRMRLPIVLPHELLHSLSISGQHAVAAQAIKEYWDHWLRFKHHHPAAAEGKHTPLGVAGDDARYTLAGAKVIIICINSILWDRDMRADKAMLLDSA